MCAICQSRGRTQNMISTVRTSLRTRTVAFRNDISLVYYK